MDTYLFPIESEYINLGQFLKLADIIDSGGQAKAFLNNYIVLVNGEEEDRRGRKLYVGDEVVFPESARFEIVNEEDPVL